jgi:predicted permease
VQSVLQDVRFALRTLRRRSLFAAVTITTIALGIGAATSVYSVVDGVLLRPLPFREPSRLVAVWQTFPNWRKEQVLAARWDRIPLSFPEYRDLRDRARTLDGIALWRVKSARLDEGERAEVVSTVQASSSLLAVLGVRPLIGRTFLAGEDLPNGPGVALVRYEQWQSRYGGNADILGRVVYLDERPYTIVGVLPPRFTVGRTNASEVAPAFWIPAGQMAGSEYYDRTGHDYHAVARLAPGVRLKDASREAARILHAASDSSLGPHGTRLVEWQSDQTRHARAPLLALLGAVGLLLVIACANVATLLLGEGSTRDREMAARLALGARRRRLARQLLTESLVLAIAGGALGTTLAWSGTRGLLALAPPDIPGLGAVRMDGRILAFALATMVATGLLFGVAPALASARTDVSGVLLGGSRAMTQRRGALQRALVAGELALSMMLLVGAGLLLRSLDRILAVDPGFRPGGLLVIETSLPLAMAAEGSAVHKIYSAVLTRVAGFPGVRAATVATSPPFAGRAGISSVETESDGMSTARRDARSAAEHRTVSPGYFATLGTPLLAGRDFSPTDRAGAPSVAVVSEALARRDFPRGSPIGRRVRFLGEWRTIVGVVGDVRHSRLTSDIQPVIYMPFAQRDMWTMTLVVRATTALEANAGSLAPAVRRAVTEADPRLTVTAGTPMVELVRRTFAEERYRATLMSLFGVLAVTLTAVGVYGVTSRSVAHRTREVGIRLALGASPGVVVRQLAGSTLVGVGVGVAAGLVGSALVGGVLSPFLFGVDRGDPITYAGVVALLGAVSVAASWMPARHAGRIDVTNALRAE